MGFYDRKLAKTPAQPSRTVQVSQPYQTPARQETPVGLALTGKAQQAVAAQDDTGYCPNCGSGNYVGPSSRYEGYDGSAVTTESGIVRAPSRCFDCGYNPKMGSILTGYGTTGSTGDAINTRQTGSGGRIKNNFHPQEIVGRVG